MIGTVIVIIILIGIIAIEILSINNKNIVPARNERMWSRTAAYVDYIPAQSVLKVKKRGPELSKAIKILDDKDYTISYKPEEYIFTSATVGGITTGGVDKIGGYSYISGSTKTGKYQLWYIDKLIRRIQLSDTLFAQAKKSPIAEYLDKTTKEIVVISTVSPSYATQMLLRAGHTNSALDNMRRESKAGYPSYEKCIKIMNWLCSDEEFEPTIEPDEEKKSEYSENVGTREAAEILGVAQTVIQKMCREGKFKTAVRDEKTRVWRISKQELLERKNWPY